MADFAQTSTSIPTRASLLEEIGALRVELDATNKKMQQCNDTIISQANELTILRNIICRTCKRKFLDATIGSSPSPAPRCRVRLPDGPTSHVVAEPTSIIPQAITTSPVPVQSPQELQFSKLAAPTSRVNREPQAGVSTSFELERTPQHAPPSQTTGDTSSSSALARSRSAVSRASSGNQTRHVYPPSVYQVAKEAFSVPFRSYAVPTSQSSQIVLPAPLSSYQPPQVGGISKSLKRLADALPPGRFSKSQKIDTISSVGTSAGPSKHESWSVTHNQVTSDKVFDATIKRAFAHPGKAVDCLKFSLDGRYIAVGISREDRVIDGKVIVYETETGKRTCCLVETGDVEQDRSGIRAVCFSPNGKLLAVGHSDGHITVWQIARTRVRNMLRGHHTGVTSLDYSPNGRSIVSTSGGTTVRVWSVRDGSWKALNEEDIINWHWYRCVKFSPNGRYLAAANMDGFLRIWNSRTRQLVVKWHGDQDVAPSLVFTPDGKGLLSGSVGRPVKYWDVSTLGDNQPGSTVTLLRKFEGNMTLVHSMAIAPDGQWLLSGSNDHTPRLCNISNGTQQCSLHGHLGRVWSVDISRVGNYLAVGDDKGQVSLWKYRVIRNRG